MDSLFLLLFLVSFVCLIIGLVKPAVFSRFIKGEITRKKTGFIFGIATITFFIMFGIATDNKQTQANTNGTVAEPKQLSPSGQAKQEAGNKDKNVPTEYKSALNKATSYSKAMHMSKQGVYDQLTSAHGEKFSVAAAQYAINNIQADWNANALAKATNYQDTMDMSPAGIHDQLTSAHGEKFTQSEADYAIQHLND